MKNKNLLLILSVPILSCVPNQQVTVVPTSVSNNSNSPTPSNSTSPSSVLPSLQNTPTPTYTSTFGGEYEKFTTVRGVVYDTEGKPVENAEVIIKVIDPLPPTVASSFKDKKQITYSNGQFVARSIPSETRAEITVSKTGYKTVVRITPKLEDFGGDAAFTFGGDNQDDKIYALEEIK